jgi:hypothetical protein
MSTVQQGNSRDIVYSLGWKHMKTECLERGPLPLWLLNSFFYGLISRTSNIIKEISKELFRLRQTHFLTLVMTIVCHEVKQTSY